MSQLQPTNQNGSGHGGHTGHGLMMIVCCIPMLVLAIVLVSTGVVGTGFIFVAIMCTVMMAMMMSMMSGGGEQK
jgi:ABC-type dipeptide/oligopeptide/nickel transport system permease subunit